jgi:hypothetical protein
MRGLFPSLALASAVLAGVVGDEHAFAQQAATFACVVAKGHVCQFVVRTGEQQINFALPSGQKKRVPGVEPRVSLYCVCDPGPVTPDCKEPRVGFWCLGTWAPVLPGVNSGDLGTNNRFAVSEPQRAD